MTERHDEVTASEAATYEFCAKAWHLEHVVGKRASRAAAVRRVEGTARHDLHWARVGRLRRLVPRLVLSIVVLFILAGALFWLALIAGR